MHLGENGEIFLYIFLNFVFLIFIQSLLCFLGNFLVIPNPPHTLNAYYYNNPCLVIEYLCFYFIWPLSFQGGFFLLFFGPLCFQPFKSLQITFRKLFDKSLTRTHILFNWVTNMHLWGKWICLCRGLGVRFHMVQDFF